MKDFLNKLLTHFIELTMVAQESHRNVVGDEYFCLHSSFQEDYEKFFEFQDKVGELMIKKVYDAKITCDHKQIETTDAKILVENYVKILDEVRKYIMNHIMKMDVIDQGLMTCFVNYLDVKLMKYNAFLKN